MILLLGEETLNGSFRFTRQFMAGIQNGEASIAEVLRIAIVGE